MPANLARGTTGEKSTSSHAVILQEETQRQEVTTETPSSTRVYRVISLCGLALRAIQVTRNGSIAVYPVAKDGLFSPAGLFAGDVVLAPGHAALTYQPSMGERIELTPALGVVLHAKDLQARTMSAVVEEQDARKADQVLLRNSLAGFTGPDELAIAFGEPSSLDEPYPKLVISLSNGKQLTCSISAGARGLYRTELPLLDGSIGAARIVIQCSSECRPTLKWWPTVRDLAVREKPRSQQFPWGSLTMAELVVPEVLGGRESQRLQGLAVGQSYSIGALCLDHGKYGKVEFVAQNDAEVVLPMHDRLQLTGSVTPPDITTIRIAAEFYQESPVPGQNPLLASWHEQQQLQVIDGRFVGFFPSDISISPRSSAPLPPFLVARAYVSGCEPKSVIVPLPTAGPAEADFAFGCQNDITLSSEGIGGDISHLSRVLYMKDGRQVIAEVKGARRVDDMIQVDINEAKSPDWQASDRPLDLVAVVLADEYYDGYACSLVGEHYCALKRVPRKVLVSVDPAAEMETIWVGWRWRGIDACYDGFTTDSSVPEVNAEMNMPSDVEGLWISATYTGFNANATPPQVQFVEKGGSLVLQWP